MAPGSNAVLYPQATLQEHSRWLPSCTDSLHHLGRGLCARGDDEGAKKGAAWSGGGSAWREKEAKRKELGVWARRGRPGAGLRNGVWVGRSQVLVCVCACLNPVLCSPKFTCWESHPPGPQRVTVFGVRAFTKGIT